MPPRGARPPDPHVLSGLDPSHRELVVLLYRLYEEQYKRRPASLEVIGGEAHLSKSVVSEALHGTGRSVLAPPDVRRLAEVLGGTPTDLNNAERLAAAIQPRKAAGWSLGGDDAADHLVMRATGRRPGDGRGGDLFTGRARVIDRIRQWLQARDCPGTALVVTGQPGAGKSSVVARAVHDLEAGGVGDGLFLHARGGTREDLLDLVRRQTRDESITGTEGWIAHLQRRATGGQPPLLVVVDALDEAVSGSETTRISQLLTTVAAHPTARVVVATRRGHRDQLLHGLGARTDNAANLVDLDSDAYFDPQDLRRVASRHLTQDDATHPGPPGQAWAQYRTAAASTSRLAAVIARRAGRSFLVAAFAAHSLSTATEVLDLGAPGFDETLIPSSVAEAFTKYFDTIPDERQRFRTRRLLTALAFAYGPGLDDDTWQLFADALGLTTTRDDILQLRRSPVADYLLETHPTESGHPVRTRLYHQALVDQLRDGAEPDDGPRILRHLTPTDDNDWATATPYVRRYLIDHTAADGDLLDLLKQPGYLSVGDLPRALATLPTQPTNKLREIAAILRLSATWSGRLTQLQQTLLLLGSAGHLGLHDWCRRLNQLAMKLGGPALLWAHSIASTPHQILVGHDDIVTAVAIGHLGDRDVIISSGFDGTIRIWDQHGNPIGHPLTGHHDVVTTIAIGHPHPADHDTLTTVAIGRLDDRDVIISSGGDGTIYIWDQHGNPVGHPLTTHHGTVSAVAIGRLDNRDVIISGGGDGTIYIWDQHGNPVGHPLTTHHGTVSAVAIGHLDNRDVIISSSGDGTIRIWDRQGHQIGEPLTGHNGWVSAVAIGRLGDRDVIISSGFDGTIRIWDQHSDPVGHPLTGHDDIVTTVAVGRLGDRDVIISGSGDGTVRIWDRQGHQIGEPLTGHDGWVSEVAIGRLDNRDVIISCGDRGTIHLWDQHGNPVGHPLTGHDDIVTTVAVGRLGDRDVIISGSHGAIHLWDQLGNPVGHPLPGRVKSVSAVAIGRLDNRDVIIIGSFDGTIYIWDQHGHSVGHPFTAHHGPVITVAVGRLDDRDVIISGSGDGTIHLWDQLGNPVGRPLPGHVKSVSAVAIGRLDNRDVIISSGFDRTIRIWDEEGEGVAVLPSVAVGIDLARSGSVVYAAVGRALVAWRFK